MLSKKSLLGAAFLSLLAVCPCVPSLAGPVSLYGSLGGSLSWPIARDYSILDTAGYTLQGVNTAGAYVDGYAPNYKLGYAGQAAIGLPMAPVRVEVEGGYSVYNLDDSGDNVNDKKFQATNASVNPAALYQYQNGGTKRMYGAVNVLYDMMLGGSSANTVISPYVGAGVGYARDTIDVTPTSPAGSASSVSRNAVLYQVKGGVSVGINAETRVYVGYKYSNTLQGKGYESIDSKFNADMSNGAHSVEGGIMIALS